MLGATLQDEDMGEESSLFSTPFQAFINSLPPLTSSFTQLYSQGQTFGDNQATESKSKENSIPCSWQVGTLLPSVK